MQVSLSTLETLTKNGEIIRKFGPKGGNRSAVLVHLEQLSSPEFNELMWAIQQVVVGLDQMNAQLGRQMVDVSQD